MERKALKSRCFYLHLLLKTIWNIVFASDVPSTPGKPLIMSFSSRTVNLSWAPPLDSHNAPVLEYVIRQRKGEDSSWETTRHVGETMSKESLADFVLSSTWKRFQLEITLRLDGGSGSGNWECPILRKIRTKWSFLHFLKHYVFWQNTQ